MWKSCIGVLVAMSVLVTAIGRSQTREATDLLTHVDHLVYATPDLRTAVERIDRLLGVRATPGGQHPGRGTRNALVALGPAAYLEIIGPDPEQAQPDAPRQFGIDSLRGPRLAAWAAKGQDLTELVSKAAARGVMLGAVTSGSRRRPDGVLLVWRFTDPRTVVADGVVPFFIDWGKSPQPAQSAARGASLVDLRAEHPEPEHVEKLLGELGLNLHVAKRSIPALVATIDGPRGRVELR